MEIKIDEQKILSGILERDGSLHKEIQEKIRDKLIEEVTRKIENEFLSQRGWHDAEKTISDRLLDDLKKKQTELVKDILKEFYSSYRYKKNNLEILKKLKEFIGENET